MMHAERVLDPTQPTHLVDHPVDIVNVLRVHQVEPAPAAHRGGVHAERSPTVGVQYNSHPPGSWTITRSPESRPTHS